MKKILFYYSVGLFALTAPLTASADTFFVNPATGNDANACTDAAAPCLTINQALILALGTGEVDTISLAAGTYTDSGGLETFGQVNSNVDIVGASTQTTIIDCADPGSGSTGFVISPNTFATISDLTITGCSDSGSISEGPGVHNEGNVTLTNLAVLNSSTDSDGGGIYNGFDVLLPGDPVATMVIINSTISGNSANSTGGGIANGGGDGNNGTGNLTMVNCTVSGNEAGSAGNSSGGGIYNDPTSSITLFNVTIANNTALDSGGTNFGGGGLANEGGTSSINNTLIANNSDATAVDANDCAGTQSSTEGYNLVEDINGCTLSGSTVGNITGFDPILGSLASNGGSTQTLALLANSPAIDAGDPGGCIDNTATVQTADQRGSTRPVAGIQNGSSICDIGAYEAPAGTTPSGGGGGGCMIGAAAPASMGYVLVSLIALLGLGVWRRKA